MAAGVDCHDDLWYCAALGTEAGRTGYVTDDNTWQPQSTSYFMKREACPEIERVLKLRDQLKRDEQTRLYEALRLLFDELFEREFEHETAGALKIGKLADDAGYLPDVVLIPQRGH